jgi:hypothetical protein
MDDDTSLSALVNNYDTVLCGILDELAPVKTRSIIVHPNALLYNDEIADEKNKRRRLDCNRTNHLAQCDFVKKCYIRRKKNTTQPIYVITHMIREYFFKQWRSCYKKARIDVIFGK